MNSLHRDLKEGDKIVMEGCPYSYEVAICMFGAMAETMGRKLGIKPVGTSDEQIISVDATEIDKAETLKRHAKENGWE